MYESIIGAAAKFPGTFPEYSSLMKCLPRQSTTSSGEESMLRRFVSNVIVALGAVVIAPVALAAQAGNPAAAAARPTWSRWTVGGAFGGLSGAANLNPAGTADWRLGWVGSVDGTVWLRRNVGIRASGSWAQDSLRGAALPGRGTFNKFTYDAALVLRYPIQAGSATLSPYVLGGEVCVDLTRNRAE